MAQAAPHPLVQRAARLARVPADVAFGLRYAIAVSAAIWLGHTPGLITNESQWILITVLMVMQPVAGGSIMTGILRGFGTLAAAIVAIVLFGLYSQNPPLLMAGLFLTQALGAYGFSGPRYQYAWFVFAFTTAIVLGSALAGTGQVETLAFQRASMVGIGILIVLLLDSVLWPSHPEASLRRSLAARARQLANRLGHVIEAPRGARNDAEPTDAGPSPLLGQLGLAGGMSTEIGASRSGREALTRVALLLETLASRRRTLARTPGSEAGSSDEASPVAGALTDLASRIEAALAESSGALVEHRGPEPFAAEIETAILRLEAQRLRAEAELPSGSEPSPDAALRRRVAALRDLVAIVRALEETLADLAAGSVRGIDAEPPAVRSAKSFRIDPFRLQIGLRTGIAVVATVVTIMALGWEINTMVAPVAFMIASAPTRGAAVQSVVPIAAVVLLGWMLADVGIVFFSNEVGRMPIALVFAFAVAGTFAYLSASRPQLATLRKIGSLLALLPIYSGAAAPTDVYGSYSTACYFVVALGVGWVSTRVFWPASAVAVFRQRAATALEICLEAFRGLTADADLAEQRSRAVSFVNRYTAQLAQLGALHEQARHEPIDGGLVEARRSELLALSQDLFDAALWARHRLPATPQTATGEMEMDLAPLYEALARHDEALAAGIDDVARVLRENAGAPPTGLEEAGAALEARLDALRRRSDIAAALGESEAGELIKTIDERRLLAVRQLAIEAWLADWHRAAQAGETVGRR